MKNIQWEQGQYGTLRGMVDSLELFTISASTSGPRRKFLRTELPGFIRQITVADESAGMEVATDLLVSFVKRLT